jgi:phosphomannomutase
MPINPKIFRANDIRGRYPSEINEGIVSEIIAKTQNLLGKNIVIGHDVRLSSPSLYKTALDTLKKNKQIKVFEAGLITSPMLYFLVNKLKASGGIMITASHNPKDYNGLKIVGKNAMSIGGKEIFNQVKSSSQNTSFIPIEKNICLIPASTKQFSNKKHDFSLMLYVAFLEKYLKTSKKIKIVFDCSSGTSGIILEKIFKTNKQIKPIFLNSNPDGNFPNHGPNPFKKGVLSQLQEKVKKNKADLGVIFDGDGDRVLFVDNSGQEIDPDTIGFILAKKFKPPYVATIINSKKIKNLKGTVMSKVGHLFMKKVMKENKANLGIERSGHYYFKDFFYCDSGIFTAIQIINFVSSLKTSLANFIENLPKHHRIPETNFVIKNIKDTEKKIKKIKNALKKQTSIKINETDGLFMQFSSEQGWWWFSLRFSNSENLLRLNMEASNKKLLKEKAKEMKRLLRDTKN